MSPADLFRLVSSLESGDELETAGLKVWKVGDSMEVDGRGVTLTELVVVQDPDAPRHGRVVMIGHATDDTQETITGSFPILFPAAITTKG